MKKRRRKNRILIVFLLIFTFCSILFLFYHFSWVEAFNIVSTFTLPPSSIVNLTILINNETCPQSEPFPHFCYGDTVNISNMLENFGNVNVSGNFTHRIFNTTSGIVNRDDWSNLNISMHEIVYINTPYDVKKEDEVGIFTITGNYNYNDSYSPARCNLWVYKGIGNLLVSEDKILLLIPPGKSRVSDPPLKLRLQYACNNAIVKMNVSSDAPGNWTSFKPQEILLLPTGEENSTEINVTVPMDTDLGPYYGWIYANVDGQQVPINLTVVVTVLDFYIKTRIPLDKKEVCQGDQVYAEVNITKIAPPGRVDFNVTYQILHEGNVIAEMKENLTLNDTFNSTIRVPILVVPSNAPTGNYTFLSHLEHDNIFFESADKFKVNYCEKPKLPEGGGGIGGGKPPILPAKKQLILNLSTTLISVTTGNSTSFVATVENTGNTAVKDVKISIEGISSDWVEMIPSIVTIPEKGMQGYLVMINVPSDAKTGVYKLGVQATDDVQSNSENLTLVIGKNIKEIADLMLVEYQKLLKEATQSLSVEDCLDVTVIKTIHEDSQLAFEKGLKEYEKKNYAQAINWFEYAIPLEQKVLARVDISIEMELLASNSSKIIMPPFYKPEEQFIRAQAYLEEKNYEKVCDPIEKIRKFILVGLVFWSGLVIIIVLVIIILVFFYRHKRRRERARILEEVRKRLTPET